MIKTVIESVAGMEIVTEFGLQERVLTLISVRLTFQGPFTLSGLHSPPLSLDFCFMNMYEV